MEGLLGIWGMVCLWAGCYLNSTSTIGLLICTLISENQGLEKSRSASNLRKISGPANLDFFLGLHIEKNHKPEKNPGDKLKKKSSFAGPENFLRLEIKVQIKRPVVLKIKYSKYRPSSRYVINCITA